MSSGSPSAPRAADNTTAVTWIPAEKTAWAGRAACAWAVVFALLSVYWAAGGLLGGETLGVEIDRLAHEREPGFVGGLWAAAALKAIAAALALAMTEAWGRRLPRRPLLVLGWATGAGITLYAVANLSQHALMASGAISTPGASGRMPCRGTWRSGIRSGWSAGFSSSPPPALSRPRHQRRHLKVTPGHTAAVRAEVESSSGVVLRDPPFVPSADALAAISSGTKDRAFKFA
jgi:hypothetical protein